MRVDVDASKAFKKIERSKRLIQRKSIETVDELAHLGATRAREIAPFWSGKTAKFIRVNTVHTKQGPGKVILSPNMHGGKRIHGMTVPQYLHSEKYANAPIERTGQPKYMDKTRNYLNRIKKGVATQKMQTIHLR